MLFQRPRALMVGTRKTLPAQVADNAQCKCQSVFALIDGRKNTTSTSCRGSRTSWALVGAGCSNQMQVAQGQGLVKVCASVQAARFCNDCLVAKATGNLRSHEQPSIRRRLWCVRCISGKDLLVVHAQSWVWLSSPCECLFVSHSDVVLTV